MSFAMRGHKPPRIPLDLHGLSGRMEIFRINGAVKRDPAVDAWLNADATELRSIARDWFARMRRCGDDVLEAMHDGCPVACVEDAPFAYVNSFSNHVNVGFYYGAMLADPAHLLEGSGKRMRHVKLGRGHEPDAKALADLISTAYADVKARLAAGRASGNG
jgi:hypothetical protein